MYGRYRNPKLLHISSKTLEKRARKKIQVIEPMTSVILVQTLYH